MEGALEIVGAMYRIRDIFESMFLTNRYWQAASPRGSDLILLLRHLLLESG